jgi:Holliday junction resolvase
VSTDGGLPKVISDYIPEADWVRIESGAVASGTPDLNGCLDGKEVWIECKATKTWKVTNIRSAQVAWMEKRSRHGGRCKLAIRRNHWDEDVLWILKTNAMRVLLDGTSLHQMPAHLILNIEPGGPAQWNWEAIREALFHV